MDMVHDEHPEWSPEEVRSSAQATLDAQLDMLRTQYNSERRFHSHAILVGLDTDEADDPDQILKG